MLTWGRGSGLGGQAARGRRSAARSLARRTEMTGDVGMVRRCTTAGRIGAARWGRVPLGWVTRLRDSRVFVSGGCPIVTPTRPATPRKRRRMQGVAAFVAILALLVPAGAAQAAKPPKPPKPAPPARSVDVQLLAINDFHGNLQPPTGSSGLSPARRWLAASSTSRRRSRHSRRRTLSGPSRSRPATTSVPAR